MNMRFMVWVISVNGNYDECGEYDGIIYDTKEEAHSVIEKAQWFEHDNLNLCVKEVN